MSWIFDVNVDELERLERTARHTETKGPFALLPKFADDVNQLLAKQKDDKAKDNVLTVVLHNSLKGASKNNSAATHLPVIAKKVNDLLSNLGEGEQQNIVLSAIMRSLLKSRDMDYDEVFDRSQVVTFAGRLTEQY